MTRTLPFVELILERLRSRDLGLREFCREVEVDPSFFSKVLAGKRSPPSEEAVLRRMAAALDLDARRLIVAAGRIPTEWQGLGREPALVDAVHRVVTGARPAEPSRPIEPPRRFVEPARRPSEPRSPERPKHFGEELL